MISMISLTFESLVNTEGIQTCHTSTGTVRTFESLVNTEGIQTDLDFDGKTE